MPHTSKREDRDAVLLDNPHIDDKTVWEIDYAYAKGTPVIGIRKDFRKSGDTGQNKRTI